jgi:16S rRNA (cytosine1402-N4)-methyltransferase
VVDATYGRGGHAGAILEKLSPAGRLIVIDRDSDAIAHARTQWGDHHNVEIVHAPFSRLKSILEQRNLWGNVNAILFDFGVSSPQLDQGDRGFSFSSDGPLDMRMDRAQSTTAASLIRDIEEKELVRILKIYGEERFARRIASRIKMVLLEQPIETTAELANIVSEAVPFREKSKHPATRTFQAIRIAVNNELQEIEQVLPVALDALAVGGRIVVISFHSLEDRIVKRFFRSESRGDHFPLDLPVTADMMQPRLQLIGKQVRAGQDEVESNSRSRSAVMRAARKVA